MIYIRPFRSKGSVSPKHKENYGMNTTNNDAFGAVVKSLEQQNMGVLLPSFENFSLTALFFLDWRWYDTVS